MFESVWFRVGGASQFNRAPRGTACLPEDAEGSHHVNVMIGKGLPYTWSLMVDNRYLYTWISH